MEGVLFGNVRVDLDPQSLRMGGSWWAPKQEPTPKAWNGEIIEFFYQRAQQFQSPRILDIGASTGSFCLIAKQIPALTGFALEPLPETFQILQNNLHLNNLTRQIQPLQLALGSHTGTAALNVPLEKIDFGFATLGNPLRVRSWDKIQVPITTLDDFITTHLPAGVDLIKIDAEGAELPILQAGRQTLQRFHPDVLAECSLMNAKQCGYQPEDLLRLMTDLGYTPTKLGEEDIYFRHHQSFRF